MTTCYFTFGVGQTHPAIVTQPMSRQAVKITGIDEKFCREAMYKMFGSRWSFQYSQAEFESNTHLKDYSIYLNIILNLV